MKGALLSSRKKPKQPPQAASSDSPAGAGTRSPQPQTGSSRAANSLRGASERDSLLPGIHSNTLQVPTAGNTSRRRSHRSRPSGSTRDRTVDHSLYRVTAGIQPEGESGRSGFSPKKMFPICWMSSSDASQLCNILWPVVPVAVAAGFINPEIHLAIFILNYVGMVPCANLIGFAGQELARKLHKVFGVLLETTLGSVVEIIMFIVLVRKEQFQVIQAAILGSILATQLLCLGMCFVIGGLRNEEQKFDEEVSEVGSDLLLTAGFGLIIPTVFYAAVSAEGSTSPAELSDKVLRISRITSLLLIGAYMIYVYFQMRTRESIYDAIFEADEEMDIGREQNLLKDKLTFTECVVALVVSISLVAMIAINLVEEIEFLVEERGVSDMFVGLILVPLVEKFAEHLTAIDEAWDNQMNLALAHVLGATIQTSLFNGPFAVLIGWGLGLSMDLNLDIFNIVVLILAIIVVGNFLRDQKSNYLEGSLCVVIYITIAVCAFYYPNPQPESHGLSRATAFLSGESTS